MPAAHRRTMAGCRHLLCATILGLILKGIPVAGNSVSVLQQSIKLNVQGGYVTLECSVNATKWTKDGQELLGKTGKLLPLGEAVADPQGVYECQDETEKAAVLQVFFRRCQNCIQLNAATIVGLGLASLVATLFLAVAVHTFTVQEPARLSQASDKQTLLANEQLYQPLGDRNNGQYSHIGVAKTRRR